MHRGAPRLAGGLHRPQAPWRPSAGRPFFAFAQGGYALTLARWKALLRKKRRQRGPNPSREIG